MFTRKIQTVGSIGEFMRGETKVKQRNKMPLQAAVATLAAGSLSLVAKPTLFAHAQTVESAGPVSDYISGQLMDKIVHAFEPLVGLLQGLSYPIALVMLTGGALFIMVGSKDRGLSLMQNAAIGYIVLQLTPMLMSLLVEVGKTVAIALPFVL
ncbi:hypothetical protein [Priestia koreensis]|uniref:hypothetical protein n=1 Tax=Priestia koreensis TaxID=284581 RepID=UPI0030169F52